MLKRAVGYLRRSTDKQEQSLEDQKREILSFAKHENFEMVNWFTDDAISGAFSENRSQFQELIRKAQLETRDFDFIIAYDVSRFSRGDNMEVGHYLYLLRKAGVEVLYVKENLKGDDVDEILRPVFQFNANLFLKGLSRDTIRGQVTSARAGKLLGGPIPYGYKRIVDAEGKATLVLDDASKVKTVQRIFKMYAEMECGYRFIVDTLNTEKIPAPRHGTWAISCVRSMLMNPVYYGAYVWNRRTLSKFHSVRNGQAEKRLRIKQNKVELNPESEWFIKENAYPEIVSKELWHRAQLKQRARNKMPSTYTGRSTTSTFLLSGIIKCEHCGHTYCGVTKTNQKGIRTTSYVCGGFWSRGHAVCDNFSFASPKLESHVIAGIKKRLTEENPWGNILSGIKEELNSRFNKPEITAADIEHEIKLTVKKIDDLLDAVSSIHKEHLNRKLGQLSDEKKKLEEELARLKGNHKPAMDLQKLSREILIDGMKDFGEVFSKNAPITERKAFIRRYVGAIRIVSKEKKALVGWYPIPKPFNSPVFLVAGAGFEPTTSRL